MKALKSVYPEIEEEGCGDGGRFNYPRPISEPPSPSSSRVTTPAPSEHGSEEEDEVDEEKEVTCQAM
jgi:glycogen synthase